MGISIGITGGIGSGKSVATKIFNTMGYPVFYADQEAKEIMNTHQEVIQEIKTLFGKDAYLNGDLNKKLLADSIFNHPELKLKINQIVHPRVREQFKRLLEESGNQLVFNEAAILFETGAYKSFDYTICVVADKNLRISRVKKRDGMTEKEVLARMNNQWSDKEKIKLADFVIYNNEDDRLLPQILKIEKEILKKE
jgi:dephospho-CoA kinase